MTTTTNQPRPIPLPAGAATATRFMDEDPQPFRIVFGADRTVVGHELKVSTSAVQWADGSLDGGHIDPPIVSIVDGHNRPLRFFRSGFSRREEG
jgi:hypothetical protein